MKKWIVGPVIAVAWLGSLYLAYGLGGMAGMFMPDRVSTAARDRYVTGHEAINFNPHDGKCYQTQDPLLGPDGRGGSVWGRLGDGLVREGLYRRVLIVPIGIGGTQLEEKQLRRMLGKHKIAAVPHGFRSSFRDWAAEETDHPREVIEAALAHGTFVTDYRGIPAGQDAPAVVVTAYRPDPTRWDET